MSLPAGGHATSSPKYPLDRGADLPITRIVAGVLVLLALGAVVVVINVARAPATQDAPDLGSFNPSTLLTDNTQHFLPTPVAALPAEADAPPPPPADVQADPNSPPADATGQQVKVANTGGVGAILRAEPPKGRQVAALRDGTVLDVIEQRDVDGSTWLHVRTTDGKEGWIFSSLVSPPS